MDHSNDVYSVIFSSIQRSFLVGGWTIHLKNMLVKLDHFPKKGWTKNIWNHHLGNNIPLFIGFHTSQVVVWVFKAFKLMGKFSRTVQRLWCEPPGWYLIRPAWWGWRGWRLEAGLSPQMVGLVRVPSPQNALNSSLEIIVVCSDW